MDSNSPDIAGIIRNAAAANGVDPTYLLATARAESGLNPNAAAGTSSAQGLFQFTGPTWKQYGGGASPTDPAASADAAARLTNDNSAALSAAGIAPTPGSLYLSHFAGAPTAIKVMQASDPNTPAASVLGSAAVKANPFLAGMSIGDLRNWSANKVAAAATPQPQAPPAVAAMPQGTPPPVPATPPAAVPPQASASPTPQSLGLLNNPNAMLAMAKQVAPGLMGGQQPQAPPPIQPMQIQQGTPAAQAMRQRLLASILQPQQPQQ